MFFLSTLETIIICKHVRLWQVEFAGGHFSCLIAVDGGFGEILGNVGVFPAQVGDLRESCDSSLEPSRICGWYAFLQAEAQWFVSKWRRLVDDDDDDGGYCQDIETGDKSFSSFSLLWRLRKRKRSCWGFIAKLDTTRAHGALGRKRKWLFFL